MTVATEKEYKSWRLKVKRDVPRISAEALQLSVKRAREHVEMVNARRFDAWEQLRHCKKIVWLKRGTVIIGGGTINTFETATKLGLTGGHFNAIDNHKVRAVPVRFHKQGRWLAHIKFEKPGERPSQVYEDHD